MACAREADEITAKLLKLGLGGGTGASKRDRVIAVARNLAGEFLDLVRERLV